MRDVYLAVRMRRQCRLLCKFTKNTNSQLKGIKGSKRNCRILLENVLGTYKNYTSRRKKEREKAITSFKGEVCILFYHYQIQILQMLSLLKRYIKTSVQPICSSDLYAYTYIWKETADTYFFCY